MNSNKLRKDKLVVIRASERWMLLDRDMDSDQRGPGAVGVGHSLSVGKSLKLHLFSAYFSVPSLYFTAETF